MIRFASQDWRSHDEHPGRAEEVKMNRSYDASSVAIGSGADDVHHIAEESYIVITTINSYETVPSYCMRE